MPEKWQQLFAQKEHYKLSKNEITPEEWYKERGGILAEFGKVIVIGLGILKISEEVAELRIKSLVQDDEKILLEEFIELMKKPLPVVCGHNIKEFDIPYLCRRLLAHSLPIPSIIDLQGKKPWEVSEMVQDTLQLWKFGDYKHYTSLDLLCTCLNIPSSKNVVKGSDVQNIYYQSKDLNSIKLYCKEDVIATAQVYLRLKGKPLLERKNIECVDTLCDDDILKK